MKKNKARVLAAWLAFALLLSVSVHAQTAVFALQEKVDVELRVRQVFDQPVDFRQNKFVQYKIFNPLGTEVAKNEIFTPLTRDGDFTISTRTDFGIAPIVNANWFGPAGGRGSSFQVHAWSSRNPDSARPAMELIAGTPVITLNGRPVNTPYTFMIEVKNEGGREVYQLFGASGGLTVDRSGGFTGKGSVLPGSATGPLTQRISYTASAGGVVDPRTQSRDISQASIEVSLARAPLGLQADERLQILVVTGAQTQASPCDNDQTKKIPQPFKIQFISFDADNFGNPSDQVSINPATEEDVKIETPFFAVCATATEIQDLAQAAQTAGLADQLRRVSNVLSPFLSVQEAADATLAQLRGSISASPPTLTMREARLQLSRLLHDITARYARADQELGPAVLDLTTAFGRLNPLEQDSNRAAIGAVNSYRSTSLTPVVNTLGTLRDRAQDLAEEPTVQNLQDVITAADNAIQPQTTRTVLDQMGARIGVAEKIFFIFPKAPATLADPQVTSWETAWRYDENRNTIVLEVAGQPRREFRHTTQNVPFARYASGSSVMTLQSNGATEFVLEGSQVKTVVFYGTDGSVKSSFSDPAAIETSTGPAPGFAEMEKRIRATYPEGIAPATRKQQGRQVDEAQCISEPDGEYRTCIQTDNCQSPLSPGAANLKCQGTLKCCVIPSATYCRGTSNGFTFECKQQAPSPSDGWIQNTEKSCPRELGGCYKKSTAPVLTPISRLSKLNQLKERLDAIYTYLTPLARDFYERSRVSRAELTTYGGGTKQEQVIRELTDAATFLNGEIEKLETTLRTPVISGQDEVDVPRIAEFVRDLRTRVGLIRSDVARFRNSADYLDIKTFFESQEFWLIQTRTNIRDALNVELALELETIRGQDIRIDDTGIQPDSVTLTRGQPVRWINRGTKTRVIDGKLRYQSNIGEISSDVGLIEIDPGKKKWEIFYREGRFEYAVLFKDVNDLHRGTVTVQNPPHACEGELDQPEGASQVRYRYRCFGDPLFAQGYTEAPTAVITGRTETLYCSVLYKCYRQRVTP
ncbi:hypothetical protein HY489_00840 [Candidatus Woesearchaeota archaeon]|nr:hypothetical protein [Candidatus Woesearchaeota archaeon]